MVAHRRRLWQVEPAWGALEMTNDTKITAKPFASSVPTSSSRPPMPSSNSLSAAASASPDSMPPNDDPGQSLVSLETLVSPDDLSVVFQPIVSLDTGVIYAHEALVRCSVADYQRPPVLFEAAVRSGCTGRLGRMIREICVPLSEGVPLFVNIHPAELSEGWLVRPDDPVYLHDDEVFLEVTESVPMTHYDLCMSVLKEVASRGSVHLVVDDLGAGYSNLMRIAELEPKVVKLDRKLIMDIDQHPRQRELVCGVVDLCTRLGATVVAEGIETVAEYNVVRETGAHFGQGYLFARPAFPPPVVCWPPLEPEHSLMPPTKPSGVES
jgi:EAL domain-containing protein (putative c-di-GMP-specific phosphodiesterase class I)